MGIEISREQIELNYAADSDMWLGAKTFLKHGGRTFEMTADDQISLKQVEEEKYDSRYGNFLMRERAYRRYLYWVESVSGISPDSVDFTTYNDKLLTVIPLPDNGEEFSLPVPPAPVGATA